MDNSRLAKRLRGIRRAAGLTQVDLARRLGMTHHTVVSKVENGQRGIGALELAAWCKACGASVGEVLNEEAPLSVVVGEAAL